MRKIIWLILGIAFLLLGIVGLFLPVIPQVPFFVMAMICLGKGSSRFQMWFEQTRLYGRLQNYLDRHKEVSGTKRNNLSRISEMKKSKINEMEYIPGMKNNDEKNKKSWKIKLIVLAVLVIVLGVFFWYENHHLVASEYQIVSEKVGPDLDGYRIVQISDLHNAMFGNANEKLIVKIIEEKPDIIVITGDIVDSNHTRMEVALNFVEAAARICPVYYVTGNHEYWLLKTEQDRLFSGITSAGATLLYNEGIVLEQGNDRFALLGLDDQDLMSDTLGILMEQVKDDQLSVLLAHEPQYISHYADFNVDVVMAGHAHGGQFRLPFIGALVAPDQGFNPTYTEGMYEEKDTKMVVSRGLGNSVIPVRLFNDPEIVVLELKSK